MSLLIKVLRKVSSKTVLLIAIFYTGLCGRGSIFLFFSYSILMFLQFEPTQFNESSPLLLKSIELLLFERLVILGGVQCYLWRRNKDSNSRMHRCWMRYCGNGDMLGSKLPVSNNDKLILIFAGLKVI